MAKCYSEWKNILIIISYGNFLWQIYSSKRFEIYYCKIAPKKYSYHTILREFSTAILLNIMSNHLRTDQILHVNCNSTLIYFDRLRGDRLIIL